jgi:hypothetical protein
MTIARDEVHIVTPKLALAFNWQFWLSKIKYKNNLGYGKFINRA